MKTNEKQRIINSIMMDAIKYSDVSTDCYVISKFTYFNTDYFKNIKNNKSFKMGLERIATPFKSDGFIHTENKHTSIFVFLDNYSKPGISRPLVRLLHVMYHELHHFFNKKMAVFYFNDFACCCDKLLTNSSTFSRLKYFFTAKGHDDNMYEILADSVGVRKTREYCNTNNIELSEKDELFLKRVELYSKNRYENYDLTKRLNKIINKFPYYIKDGAFTGYKVFSIFINDDGSVKDINSIFNKESEALRLEPRILLSFVKTNKIAQAIKNTQLTDEATELLNELLTNGGFNLYFARQNAEKEEKQKMAG